MRTQLPYAVVLGFALVSTARADDEATAQGIDEEVFFAFDSAVLSEAAKTELADVAARAEEDPNAQIVLGGHADAIGTAAYNTGLSARRVEAVRDHLMTTYGIDRDRVVLAVFGEEAPRRDTRLEDRRVSVQVTRDPLYVIVDRTLADGIALIWGPPVTTAEIDGPLPDQVAER